MQGCQSSTKPMSTTAKPAVAPTSELEALLNDEKNAGLLRPGRRRDRQGAVISWAAMRSASTSTAWPSASSVARNST